MKSIQNRVLILLITGVLLVALLVGSVSILNIWRKSENDVSQTARLICSYEAEQIDGLVQRVQKSVDMEATFLRHQLTDLSAFQEDASYRAEFSEELEKVYASIAGDTDGAAAYYVRYAEELAESEQGFLYIRDSEEGVFREIELTNLATYPEDDTEHVGWYYIPLNKGEPTWLEPYYNRNMDIYMISYVIPVFQDDVFIGVVGMDIDFGLMQEELREVPIYSTGQAFFLSADGGIYDQVTPESEFSSWEERISEERLKELLTESDGGNTSQYLSYRQGGVKWAAMFYRLQNGMRLILTVESREINQDRNQLTEEILTIMIMTILVVGIGLRTIWRQIMRPLDNMTQMAQLVAAGSSNAVPDLTTQTREIQALLDAYQMMKQQIDDINVMALQDGLTGLGNKTAYNVMTVRLDQKIHDGTACFGFLVLDVNDLKEINDRMGHQYGDQYLKLLADLLKEAYPMSDIYRIGGDEFLVVSEDEETQKIPQRLRTLQDTLNRTFFPQNDTSPKDNLSVAAGAAVFDAKTDENTLQVFARADAEMYRLKRRMKQMKC